MQLALLATQRLVAGATAPVVVKYDDVFVQIWQVIGEVVNPAEIPPLQPVGTAVGYGAVPDVP
jgi:hypothetical protein